jgi:hypothetical protein
VEVNTPAGALRRGVALPSLLATASAAAAVAAVVAVRAAGVGASPRAQEFVLVFTSITIEALPFILLGALVSSVLAVYVPDRAFARVGRLPVHGQVPGAMVCALAFPACECRSATVARRLIGRGVHPSAGLAFMLGAHASTRSFSRRPGSPTAAPGPRSK